MKKVIAIRHNTENFEVKYYINPIDSVAENLDDYAEDFLAIASIKIAQTDVTNIPQIYLFPKEGVKNEFNADWGGTSAILPKSKFGKGYEFCSVNSIKKKDIGQAFFIFMFSDYKKQSELPMKCYHAIKFK